jgi:hypothetical protein
VTTERQIIVAAEIAPDGLDFAQLDRMVSAAERELAETGVTGRPEVALADAGYWSNEHIDRLRKRGGTRSSRPTPTAARDRARRGSADPTTLYAQGPSKRQRSRALLTATVDGRAGVRRDQAEPPLQAIQTQRPGGRSLGMAPDRRHAQPAEAPTAHADGRRRLIGRGLSIDAVPRNRPRRLRGVCATASLISGALPMVASARIPREAEMGGSPGEPRCSCFVAALAAPTRRFRNPEPNPDAAARGAC